MSETSEHPNLTAALAAFQAELPRVRKEQEGKIQGKDGKQGYSYSYASLDDISPIVLPALARQGISWMCTPRITDRGYVLVGTLAHVSGLTETSEWPLPTGATPQTLGGALTYGRRYLLLAMTGVAPGGDDDDAQAAEQHYQREQEHRRDREMRAASAPPPAPEPTTDPAWLDEIRSEIAASPTVEDAKAAWQTAKQRAASGGVAKADMAALSRLVTDRLAALREATEQEAADAAARDEAGAA